MVPLNAHRGVQMRLFAISFLGALTLVGSAIAAPSGSISGQAFIQTSSGTPMTCAGQEDVLLIPETTPNPFGPHLGTADKAFLAAVETEGRSASGGSALPSPPLSGARLASCNAEGNFRFADVAPGSYLVVSKIVWGSGGLGGQLIRRVVVSPSSNSEVILSHLVETAPTPAAVLAPQRDAREVLAEAAIRQRLIDPSSAEFQWSGRWVENTTFKFWRWSKPVVGDFTCGMVNARNRMGGFAGRTYFLVGVRGGQIVELQMGTGSEIDLVQLRCQKDGF